MRVAAHHPELIRTLTLMNTTATREKLPNRIRYNALAQMVKIVGVGPFTPITVKELFGRSTRQSAEKRAMLNEWTAKLRARPRNIAPSLQAVMNRRQFRAAEMAAIDCPTLDHHRRGRYGAAAAQLGELRPRASVARALSRFPAPATAAAWNSRRP